MGNERNNLSSAAASLLSRNVDPGSAQGVALARKGGRRPKENPSGWNSKRDYRTSLVMDHEQYNEIRRLANSTGITLKQLMYLLLDEGLRRQKSGELVISDAASL